jgi:hypothetical protein
MDDKWRNGSKQFIDFTIVLTDPTGDLTQSEVEAVDFEILVTTTSDTPERDDAGWGAPSVPKTVETVVAGQYKVSILHLYTAAAKGVHYVWVKFGPTPEEPIYQAATFVVL